MTSPIESFPPMPGSEKPKIESGKEKEFVQEEVFELIDNAVGGVVRAAQEDDPTISVEKIESLGVTLKGYSAGLNPLEIEALRNYPSFQGLENLVAIAETRAKKAETDQDIARLGMEEGARIAKGISPTAENLPELKAIYRKGPQSEK